MEREGEVPGQGRVMCIRVCDMTVQRELHPVSHPPGLFNWTVPTLNYTISHVPRHPVTLTPGLPSLADIYSAGCVLAELLLGQLIFPRDSGVEQLVQTTKVRLGVGGDSESVPGVR
ncbi:glycogen synthase kinase-3 beta-like isoform X1 [Narcine bancroftii]|uniref:glycogen synthase kinase-3 beta-like isoform X1 n=1 Tax=Narcine bancroftii TaxID=1343680 RepID=UPI003831DB92